MSNIIITSWGETAYPGSFLPADAPLVLGMAGVTHPNRDYRIVRRSGDGPYVLEYVIRGRGYVRYDGHNFSPSAGDVYLLHAGVPQEYHSDPYDPWEKIWFNIRGPLMESLIRGYRLQDKFYFQNCPVQDDFFAALEMVRRGTGADREHFVLQIHRIIMRLHQWCNDHPGSRKSPEGKMLKEYLDRNVNKKVSLADLSRLAGKTPAQIIRIFRKDWNCTPGDYWQQQRVDSACRYLENTDCSVKELAGMLGFPDEFYFSNWFKVRTGLAPSFYRQKFR